MSRDLIFLNSSKLPEQEQLFLLLYCQTEFFNRLLIRSSSQTAQPHLTITLVRSLPLFRGSGLLKEKLAALVHRAQAMQALSIRELQVADDELRESLKLQTLSNNTASTYVRPSAEVFAAGRFDAEFFAPRVKEILEHLAVGGRRMRDVSPPRYEKFVPAARGEFQYIEIGGVRSDGTVRTEAVAHQNAPSRATWVVRSGDVITSTVRPLRRLSALITTPQDGAVCSSGFVVLRPAMAPSELILTYLRLMPVCELMDLYTSASMYPAISERDILSLPFRAVGAADEGRIVTAVREAQTARSSASQHMVMAKYALDLAIAAGESTAFAYLDKNAE